ncbi:MAG: DUF1499 domain-containing protein [Desulfobacterales bacterium]
MTIEQTHGFLNSTPEYSKNKIPKKFYDNQAFYSKEKDKRHAIEPFYLKGDPNVSWPVILGEIASMPKWRIVKATGNYIHVECRSRIFHFFDGNSGHFFRIIAVIGWREIPRDA